ncbi:ribonucleoside diphosphate reductase large subunit, rr1 [Earliella scabrosa]|nr:ribonucleoside diphosphate reductase large subunit, rr1 [Earliella scabrosa]
MSSRHPAYSLLAGRLRVADIHKSTGQSFSAWLLSTQRTGRIDPDIVELVHQHAHQLDAAIVHSRDFTMGYGPLQTLLRSYLIQGSEGRTERPQFLYMRLALAIHRGDVPRVLETYDTLSRQLYTHASPTLFNASTTSPNYASCFIVQPNAQSPRTILSSAGDLDDCWMSDGGVGISLADVPSRRSQPVRQPGVMALMQVYDSHANYTILSRGHRPSSATIYLPIWHADVQPFIQCRTHRAGEGDRVRHIFPAIWIPDVFMFRLNDGSDWFLFDPADVPRLSSAFGEQFTALYEECVETVRPIARIPATQLWRAICEAQTESGAPFIIYQDNVNRRNSQRHLGPIKSSNMCTEIMQYSSPSEPAVCILASVALPRFIRLDNSFDFDMLHAVTKIAVRNTDRLIDRSNYPSNTAAVSAHRTRAIGIGVQGLADTFMAIGIPYSSDRARDLNVDIFETVYHAALETSCELAEAEGPYPAWADSPASHGELYFDMWPVALRRRFDFDSLRTRIARSGLRNSLLTAQMPTSSTAHILGNSEGVEPYTSNIVTYQTLSGDFTHVCPWLVRDLSTRDLWTNDMRQAILHHHGSVQAIDNVPEDLKAIYRTAWEIEPFTLVEMAIDRAPYVDQSQSLTLSVDNPSTPLLMRLQNRAWERGLKTGVYYLRTKSPSSPIPYGVIPHIPRHAPAPEEDKRDSDQDDDDLPPPLEEAQPSVLTEPTCCDG